jgi:DNA-binding response OmpR family regulator
MAKVLVVDDTEDHLCMFTMLLNQQQHEVETAMSPDMALVYVDSFKPDIILMDVILRNYSGRVLCKQIKNVHPHIHIILVSADPSVLQNYKKCGADGIIEKPFDITAVYNIINGLIPA